MIEINLLPGAGRKKAARAKTVDFSAVAAGFSGRLRDRFLIGSVAALIVSAVGVGALYVLQTTREATLGERREVALRDSTRYANFLKDRYRAEATRDTLLRQVNVIRSIDEDRYVWPHVLDEISRALPQYTWLTAVSFTGTPQGTNNVVVTPKGGAEDTSAAAKKRQAAPRRMDTVIPKDVISIRVSGRTVDIQAVTRFMKDLEASPYLSNVQLDKSELAVEQGKEVAQFQLTIGYSRPDSLMLHRVPLTLSVR
jgi:type IV pilus assembly protein PilN